MAKKVVFDSDCCENCESDNCTVSLCPAVDADAEGKPSTLDKSICSDCGDCVADCTGNPKAFRKE